MESGEGIERLFRGAQQILRDEWVESGEGIESGASDPERRRQHMWNPVKELKEKIQILNNVYLLR